MKLWGVIARAWQGVSRLNERAATLLNHILSYSIWLNIIGIGSIVWIIYEWHDQHAIDPAPNFPLLILALTVLTAVDAIAAKIVQTVQHREAQALSDKQQLILEGIADLTVSIREELDNARARDTVIMESQRQQAAKDEAMFAILDRYAKGGDVAHGSESK